jgi:hypothetical protein
MAVSVLPKIVSQIEGNDTQSAIYRLLQCISELCNVSERNSYEELGNKRRKIGLVRSS